MIRHPLGEGTDDLPLLVFLLEKGPVETVPVAVRFAVSVSRARAWLTWLERQGLIYDERGSTCCLTGWKLTVPGYRRAVQADGFLAGK